MMTDPGGSIHVALHLSDGRVSRVDLGSTRRDLSAALFRGMTPEDAIARVGRVYALCGLAQTVASCAAIEDARGLRASAATQAARDLLRLSEMVSQTALRLCLHWPPALGLLPEPETARQALAVQDAALRALGGMATGAAPAGDMAELRARSGDLLACIDRLAQPGGLRDLLREDIDRRGWQGFGALPLGAAPEQGALSRQWGDREVATARAAHGAGLRARLDAGFADLAALAGAAGHLLDRDFAAVSAPGKGAMDGGGSATVETARGALTHRVSLRDGRIADYRIDAPTETNFAPGGPVAAGLLGAGEAGIETAARLHVLAIDPCVDFTVEVRHA